MLGSRTTPSIALPVAILAIAVLATTLPAVALAQSDQAATRPVPELRAEPSGTSLTDLIVAALEASPELAAARARVAAAAQGPDQAGSLPDPVLGVSYRNVGFPGLTLGQEMMSMAGLTFTQAVPAKGKRPARTAAAARMIEVARARIEPIRRRLIHDVGVAFFELAFVTESLEIVQETKLLLETLETTAASRYAVGEGIQQDVLRAQVEISVLLNRLILLQQQRGTIETRIQRLLARSSPVELGAPDATELPAAPLDLATLLREADCFSAMLAVQHRMIEQQRATVDLTRLDQRPDLVLGGSWMNRGSLPSVWQLNVGITLPVRQSQRQDRAIEQALLELDARRQDHVSVGLSVSESVREAYLRVDRSLRLIALFRDAILPQSMLSLESAMAGYSVGKVDFLTVLNNVITLLTYRLELERETTSYMVALTDLEEHVGHSLGATPPSVWAEPDDGSVAARGRTTAGAIRQTATAGEGQ